MYRQGTSAAPLADMTPVAVTVIGTGDGASKIMATTPGEFQPDILVKVIHPIIALAVRIAHAYGGVFVSFLSAGVLAGAIQIEGFYALVVMCAVSSIPGTFLIMTKDIVTMFGKLEQKYPLWTGSV